MTARLLCCFCGSDEYVSGVCRVCLDKAKARYEAHRAPLTDPMLQARDIIFDCLMVRRGTLLTEMVARERANNCAQALMDLLTPGALPLAVMDDDDKESDPCPT